MVLIEVAGIVAVMAMSVYAGMIIERRKHAKRREVTISAATAITLPDGVYYKRLHF